MSRPRSFNQNFYQESFKYLAQNETNSKTKIRFMALNNIQKGETYANTANTFLVTIDSINNWIARYKKGGRVQLKDIDELLKSSFDIHYKNLSGVHNFVTKLGIVG